MSLPLGLLDAFIEMLPRLEAEESIDAASRAAAAWGGDGSKRLLEQWQHQAAGIRPGERPAAPPATVEQVVGMGIGYYVAPSAAAPAGAPGHLGAEDGATGDGG